MADIRTQGLIEPVDVVEYLFKRLHEVGVRSVHGLPGDFNLVALDYLPQCGLKWVGNVNELNAGQYPYNLSTCQVSFAELTSFKATLPMVTPVSRASLPSSLRLVLASSPPSTLSPVPTQNTFPLYTLSVAPPRSLRKTACSCTTPLATATSTSSPT